MTTGAKKRAGAKPENGTEADPQPESSSEEIGETEWSVLPMSGKFAAPEDWQAEQAELVAEDTTEPVAKGTTELVAEDTIEPVAKGTTEPAAEDTAEPAAEDTAAPPRRRMILGALFLLLSFDWLVLAGWIAWQARATLTPDEAVQWVPVLSLPLILLGIGWLIFGRTSRRETERFTRAISTMRNESAALESQLALIATHLEENHARVIDEAASLMSLGDEAADRLSRVAQYLAKESDNLDRKSESLESAAASARVDIGVLLQDLPRAEEQARSVAEAMKDAGFSAHEQSGALESQLSALIARGREADEVLGGAAQRLAAHLARIEATTVTTTERMDEAAGSISAAVDASMSRATEAVDVAVGDAAQRLAAHLARIETTATTATERMDEAAGSISAAVDASMSRAAEAVDVARAGLQAQSDATLAMIEQSRSALEQAGDEASRLLAERLDMIGTKIEGLAEHLAAHESKSQALMSNLSKEVAELDQRFVQLADRGVVGTETLESSIEAVRRTVDQLSGELTSGTDRAGDFITRAQEMAQTASGLAQQLNADIPSAFAVLEEQAARTHAVAASIGPEVDAIRTAAAGAAEKVSDSEASLARQHETMDRLLERVTDGLGTADQQLRALAAAADDADNAARRIVADTGPELIEAMLRVRETAQQAAERARETISAIIPATAATLGEASREAVLEAVSGTVTDQLGVLTELAERAVAAAKRASERLTRQMLAIGKTTAAIEARIEESQREREEQESQSLSRTVALLIESLNSTAIDVTKLLSNEVTDTAWTSYLKGDRGVFTRRAVRLLSSGEARTIAQHYEDDQEFREQVNRYIHDFEAMLRRVLVDREGSPLGVTLLSSDMGKLYVALAQAIERLR